MRIPQILIVDDDSVMLAILARASTSAQNGARVCTAPSAERAVALARATQFDAAVIDLSLDSALGVESGFSLIRALLEIDRCCRIIVLTGHAPALVGPRALALGAAHFVPKPADSTHLNTLIRDSIFQSELRRADSVPQRHDQAIIENTFVGTSAAARRLREEISFAAAADQSVFLRGETGTGKGLCAELIHQLSARRSERFIRFQPRGGSADLVNSELFGHTRGAFTGAASPRRGLLEETGNGTFFLDEIDQLPLETQVSMLGVLHERSFRALGSNCEIRAAFRLISASNSPIEELVRQGTFRRDLYYRVARYQISIPPLRERREDIEAIAMHTVRQFTVREKAALHTIDGSALASLAAHDWPGNARELESAIETAAWRAHLRGSMRLEERDFERSVIQDPQHCRTFHARVRQFEQELVRAALRNQNGSYSAAARSLGIDRGTAKRIVERGD